MIEIKHIRKEYQSSVPLKDVSLTINEGEVVTLIGPSGTGKSTLLRMINMLERPTSGQIYIDGEEITAPGYNLEKLRQKVVMVFQSFNLFNHMTVIENVCYAPIKLKGMKPSEAYAKGMELLEKVGMKAQALKYPDQLSGGQKQRVAIARSVAMSPEIILLDEPTSALDPTMVGEVQKVIQALCRQGYTIVLVSHDMKFVEKVSDRVVFLDEGEVCEEGTPDQIFHNMKKEKTRAFIKQFKTFECRIDPDNADYVSFYTPLNNFTFVNNIEVSIRTKIIAIFEELCFQILIPKSRAEGSRFGIHFIVEYSETDHKASVRVTYTGVSASQDDEEYELPWTIVKHNCESIEFDKESEDSETVLAIVGK